MTDQALPPPHHHPHVSELFVRRPTRRLEELREGRPPRVADLHIGINGKIALLITASVGTMWAAYLFTVISLVSAPSAFSSGQLLTIVSWIAQTFLQLVLLPVIIVGQNIQGKAADKRADDTYKDAEAILHECMQLQEHLQAQDKVLDALIGHMHRLTAASAGGAETAPTN